MLKALEPFKGLNVTFNTTESCNLNCLYCYENHKTPKILSFEDARKFIDLLIKDPDPTGIEGTDLEDMAKEGFILEFLGGDALIDCDLVRKILNYFMWKSNLEEHPLANRWRASISTNGTLFGRQDVRDFLEEFIGVVDLSVSVDGVKEIHDANRVFPDGTGSMDVIIKNWPWYLDYCKRSGQQPKTKATLSKNSIPYIYDSLKFLHEDLKLNYIFMNFIMEDSGIDDNDLTILDQQLEKCYNYLLDNDDVYFSMFDKYETGEPFTEENKNKTRCGSGAMPTIGIDGKIYPCFRWLPASMNRDVPEEFLLGNVEEGLINKLGFISFEKATGWEISDDECRECPIQSACNYCIAGCYSEFGEFKRTKHICGITKIKSKWVKKYWDDVENIKK